MNLSLTLQLLCGARACICVFLLFVFTIVNVLFVILCTFFFYLSHTYIVHLTVDVILGNLATQLTQNEWLTNEKSFAPIQIRSICFANTHKSSSLIISMWISFANPFQMINYSKYSIQIQMDRFIDDRRDRFCNKHIDFFRIDSNTPKETSFRNVLPWFRLTEKKHSQNSVIVYYNTLLNRIKKKK